MRRSLITSFTKISRLPAPLRIGLFLLILGIFWAPIALPAYRWIPDPNTINLVTLPVVYLQFLLWVRVWGRHVHQQPSILKRYGVEISRRSGLDLILGLVIGMGSLWGLFLTELALGWLTWNAPISWQFVLEGGLVGIAIGIAEEILFRGWLLDELERDYRPAIATWSSAIIFAIVHGFKPQFPALVILGVTLAWAKRVYQVPRLALSMGLHGGLVWGYYILNVGKMTAETGAVPSWVTGIDRNPLAGLMACLFLLGLLVGMRHFATRGDRSS